MILFRKNTPHIKDYVALKCNKSYNLQLWLNEHQNPHRLELPAFICSLLKIGRIDKFSIQNGERERIQKTISKKKKQKSLTKIILNNVLMIDG